MWTTMKGPLSKAIREREDIKNNSEMSKFAEMVSREILIDNITPAIADEIDHLIRIWNEMDDEKEILFAERKPIKIYIDSYGGNMPAALTIMDSINMSRTPIYTINIGCVYKESFWVYLMGHKRYCYPDATFMYHKNIPPFDEQEQSQESTFYNYTSFWNKQEEELKRILIDKTKITETQYEKHSKNDWWFVSDDALKLRICNDISRSHSFKN